MPATLSPGAPEPHRGGQPRLAPLADLIGSGPAHTTSPGGEGMDASLYVATQEQQVLARALDLLGLRGAPASPAPIDDRRHEAKQPIAAPSREHEARPAETRPLRAPRMAPE